MVSRRERKGSSSEPSPAPFRAEKAAYRRALGALAAALVALVAAGSFLLDLRSLTGNRIFTPVLTILLTSANEAICGGFGVIPEAKKLLRRAIKAVGAGTVFLTFAATCFGAPLTKTLDTVNWAFFQAALTFMPGACMLAPGKRRPFPLLPRSR